MDFSFTEDQETVGKVARQLFEHRATPEHLTEVLKKRGDGASEESAA